MNSFKGSFNYHMTNYNSINAYFNTTVQRKNKLYNENAWKIRVNEPLMRSLVTDDSTNSSFTNGYIGNLHPYMKVLHAVVKHAGHTQRRVFLHKICLFLNLSFPANALLHPVSVHLGPLPVRSC